jgi:hypothetical protein
MQKSTRFMAKVALLLLVAAPAGADGQSVEFLLSASGADPTICRTALESGKVLRSDETGTYIFSGYHLFRFTVEADKLTCTAMFVANP